MESRAFRDIMAKWASGVAIVTTADDGHPYGITVSSFISLTVAPPSILISIDKASAIVNAIRNSRKFALTILREDQEETSRAFASHSLNKFDVAGRNLHDGLPYINGLATLFVDLKIEQEAYDHVLFIGDVIDGNIGEGRPLLYWNRGYRAFSEL